MYSCLLFTHSKHTARELTPVWVSKNLPRETGRAVLGKDACHCQPSEHASGLHRPPAPQCVLSKIDLAILPPRVPFCIAILIELISVLGGDPEPWMALAQRLG